MYTLAIWRSTPGKAINATVFIHMVSNYHVAGKSHCIPSSLNEDGSEPLSGYFCISIMHMHKTSQTWQHVFISAEEIFQEADTEPSQGRCPTLFYFNIKVYHLCFAVYLKNDLQNSTSDVRYFRYRVDVTDIPGNTCLHGDGRGDDRNLEWGGG